jgi:hypothetical protein
MNLDRLSKSEDPEVRELVAAYRRETQPIRPGELKMFRFSSRNGAMTFKGFVREYNHEVRQPEPFPTTDPEWWGPNPNPLLIDFTFSVSGTIYPEGK